MLKKKVQLHFSDPKIEEAYQAQEQTTLRKWAPRVILLGSLIYSSFLIVDYFVFPNLFMDFVWNTLFVNTVCLISYLLCRWDSLQRYLYIIMLSLYMAVGLGTIHGGYITHGAYWFALPSAFVFFEMTIRGRFFVYAYSSLGLFVVFLAAVFFRHQGEELRYLIVPALTSSVLLVTLATAYISEVNQREAFLKDHQLQLEKKKVIQAKEAAEKANYLKTAFLANMSHEIRTPMNAVLGFSELLLSENPSEKQKEYLNYISKAGEHLLRLINQILDLSKIEAGQLECSKQPCQALSVLQEVEQTARILLEKQGSQVTLQPLVLEDPKLSFIGDEGHIVQILNNLISNAIKFTEQGSISLGLKKKEDRLEFFVRDTGPGIDPKDQELIFESFRQTDMGMNRKYGGTGLGLTISRKLAAIMGGTLTLESQTGKNHGSTFCLSIPYIAPVSTTKKSLRMPMETQVLL